MSPEKGPDGSSPTSMAAAFARAQEKLVAKEPLVEAAAVSGQPHVKEGLVAVMAEILEEGGGAARQETSEIPPEDKPLGELTIPELRARNAQRLANRAPQVAEQRHDSVPSGESRGPLPENEVIPAAARVVSESRSSLPDERTIQKSIDGLEADIRALGSYNPELQASLRAKIAEKQAQRIAAHEGVIRQKAEAFIAMQEAEDAARRAASAPVVPNGANAAPLEVHPVLGTGTVVAESLPPVSAEPAIREASVAADLNETLARMNTESREARKHLEQKVQKWEEKTNAKGLGSMSEFELQKLYEQKLSEAKQIEEELTRVRPPSYEPITSYNEEHIPPEGNEAIVERAAARAAGSMRERVLGAAEKSREFLVDMGEKYNNLKPWQKMAIGACLVGGAGVGLYAGIIGAGTASAAMMASRALSAFGMFGLVHEVTKGKITNKWARFGTAGALAAAYAFAVPEVFRTAGGYLAEWGITEKLASIAHQINPFEVGAPSGIAATLAEHELAEDRVSSLVSGAAALPESAPPVIGVVFDAPPGQGVPPLDASAGHASPPGAAPAAPAVAPMEYTVKLGDNSYKVLQHLSGVERLSPAQQANAFENFLRSEQFKGLHIDLDHLKPGQVLPWHDLQTAFNGATINHGESLVAHAQHLSPDAVQRIETNNAQAAFGHATPDAGQPHATGDQGNPLPEHKPASVTYGPGSPIYTSVPGEHASIALHPESAAQMSQTIFGNEQTGVAALLDTKMSDAFSHMGVGNEADPAQQKLLGYVGTLVDHSLGINGSMDTAAGVELRKMVGFQAPQGNMFGFSVGARQYGVGLGNQTVQEVLQKIAAWKVKYHIS